jgi:response regulator of citrate/malate metabolism
MPVKILIVEDDNMLCTVFEMFITGLGYELIGITQTGKDAIDLIQLQKPDVVLMDIHLDGNMDGIEASKIIYEKFNLPVIYISSDVEDETVKRSIQPNTYGFLVKPIYKSILETTIKFCIAKHNLDSERIKSNK